MPVNVSKTLLALILKGGWVMVPLFLISLLSLTIIVERMLVYQKSLNLSRNKVGQLTHGLHHGDIDQVHALCMGQHGLLCTLIEEGIRQHKSGGKNVELMLKNEAQKAISALEEHLSFLATISGIAPMLGFLGTVIGMVHTFMVMSEQRFEPLSDTFSTGLYEAMITTIVGLIIGIISHIGYNYFIARVNKASSQVEYFIHLFLCKV